MFETTSLPDDILFENLTSCDLCGSDELENWDMARSNNLSRCRKCDLVFTNPRIKNIQEKDKIIYSKNYFQQKSRMTDEMIDARKKTYRIEINELSKIFKSGRILDVGCGMGVFLDCFGDEWEKFGCDISSYALEIASTKGITVYHGEFEHFELEHNLFDVVYFRASLHHSYSPKRSLKNAYHMLKPNGVIVISMSNNKDGFAGRLFKAHVKSYEQGHNYLFSRSTLEAYLQNTGFSIMKVYYPYWGTGYESYRDFIDIFSLYIKYSFLKRSHKLNRPENYNFSSPTFYGNYINIYARKISK